MVDVLVIDNIDSFVYNIVQYIGEFGVNIEVVRNDISFKKIDKINPSKIVISPGPGRPENAGISVDVVRKYSSKIPILGVCLGHQCIGYAFGAKIGYAKNLVHGKISEIQHDGKLIYKDVKNPFVATRYHSLTVDDKNFPNELEITAKNKNQEIMGIRHINYPTEGVQFHPESILTEEGKKIIKNFINLEV